jgi:hypothetical protein
MSGRTFRFEWFKKKWTWDALVGTECEEEVPDLLEVEGAEVLVDVVQLREQHLLGQDDVGCLNDVRHLVTTKKKKYILVN